MCVSQWEKERSKKQKENKIKNVFSYSFSFTFQQTHSHTQSIIMIAQKQQQWQLYSIIWVCFIFKEKPFSVRKLKRPTVAAATAAAVVANGEKRVSLTKWKKDRKRERKTFKHYRTLLLQTGATTATVSADQRLPFVVYWLSLSLSLSISFPFSLFFSFPF